jgi:hypothetical protein
MTEDKIRSMGRLSTMDLLQEAFRRIDIEARTKGDRYILKAGDYITRALLFYKLRTNELKKNNQ